MLKWGLLLLLACGGPAEFVFQGDSMPYVQDSLNPYDDEPYPGERQVLRRPDKPPPLVRAIEPEGLWNQDNSWAQKISRQPFPAVPGVEIQVITKVSFPGPPRPRGVHLVRNNEIAPDDTTNNADIFARVTYGLGGVTATFDCDWVHGQSFTVPAGTISVSAISYAPANESPYAITAGQEIELGVEFDDWGGIERPVYTQQISLSAGTIIDIPNYATEVYIVPQDGGGAPNPIEARLKLTYFSAGQRVPVREWVPLGSARLIEFILSDRNYVLVIWKLAP